MRIVYIVLGVVVRVVSHDYMTFYAILAWVESK